MWLGSGGTTLSPESPFLNFGANLEGTFLPAASQGGVNAPQFPGAVLPQTQGKGKTSSPSVPKALPGDWKCASCGDLQFARNATCRKCGNKRPDGVGPVSFPPPHMTMPGDWNCTTCGDLQFARNPACRKCGAARPESAGPIPGSGRKSMPGDWSCKSCGDHQFARNASCRRCGSKRPDDAPPLLDQARPGDWACANCGDLQHFRSSECRRCGASKSLEVGSVAADAHAQIAAAQAGQSLLATLLGGAALTDTTTAQAIQLQMQQYQQLQQLQQLQQMQQVQQMQIAMAMGAPPQSPAQAVVPALPAAPATSAGPQVIAIQQHPAMQVLGQAGMGMQMTMPGPDSAAAQLAIALGQTSPSSIPSSGSLGGHVAAPTLPMAQITSTDIQALSLGQSAPSNTMLAPSMVVADMPSLNTPVANITGSDAASPGMLNFALPPLGTVPSGTPSPMVPVSALSLIGTSAQGATVGNAQTVQTSNQIGLSSVEHVQAPAVLVEARHRSRSPVRAS